MGAPLVNAATARLRAALLLLAALAVASCHDHVPAAPKPADGPSGSPSGGESAGELPKPAAPEPAHLVQLRVYDCPGGRPVELKDYDDNTTRVDLGGAAHVLRTVEAAGGGSLLQDDSITVRLVDDQLSVSEHGVVLSSGCRKLR